MEPFTLRHCGCSVAQQALAVARAGNKMEGMKEVEKINTEDLIHEVEKHFSSLCQSLWCRSRWGWGAPQMKACSYERNWRIFYHQHINHCREYDVNLCVFLMTACHVYASFFFESVSFSWPARPTEAPSPWMSFFRLMRWRERMPQLGDSHWLLVVARAFHTRQQVTATSDGHLLPSVKGA